MRFLPDSFKVSTPDDRSIHVERDFNAPRDLVFGRSGSSRPRSSMTRGIRAKR